MQEELEKANENNHAEDNANDRSIVLESEEYKNLLHRNEELKEEVRELNSMIEKAESELNSVRALFETKQNLYLKEMESEINKLREKGDRERQLLEGENENLRWKSKTDQEEVESLRKEVEELQKGAKAASESLTKLSSEKKEIEAECRKLVRHFEKRKLKTEAAMANMYREIVGSGGNV